ncbi:MAG: DUF2147 domain-containing protein [Hyphomicrobiaceae bacterium]|nr:DUF2147 domain-containing protein [Hyphomicrobiaceae bacterium]
MKKAIAVVVGLAALGFSTAAFANPMVGKWKWDAFTIECKEGGANGMSCVVVDGPKNKGMEMVKSKLEAKDGAHVGQIAHPMTGETYNAKMVQDGADAFKMDGCTAAGACASGTFTRVK